VRIAETAAHPLESKLVEHKEPMQGARGDSPGLPAENADDLPKIAQQALGILEAADAQAEEMVLSAIQANDGIDPGDYDLDIGGVRYAKDMALKIRQAGNTVATELLYNAYADRHMTRASSANGFIATLDIIFQRVVEALKGRTDRGAIKTLTQKWTTIARNRAAEGWFVARAPKITMGEPIAKPIFWSDLEERFRDLRKEYGDRLTANWISSAWGEDGEQWCLRGGQGRESEMFKALVERGAVGLGHPPGNGALFFWLDQLKSAGLNFRAVDQETDIDGDVSHGGVITRLGEASADYCFKMETKLVGQHGSPETPELTPSLARELNVPLINKWMKDEGYSNKELAGILNLSVRAVSSMRNNGQYHGINAVIKLANQMKCDPDDLYLP
jgi:hypothetical protein